MDASYIVWQAEGEPLTIEFSRLLVEQIRQACYSATNGVLRGGKGVGGLLFGTRLGSLWRVLAWKPITCSYPRGEPFHLSGADEIALETSLSEAPPQGMTLVGWFASHPRGGLLLSAEEQRIHAVFFSASERLMLTMRATRGGDLALAVHAPRFGEPGSLEARRPELKAAPMAKIDYEAVSAGIAGQREPRAFEGRDEAIPGPVKTTYFAVGFSGVLVATAALAVLAWQLTQTGLLASPGRLAASFSPPARLLSLHIGHDGSRLEVKWDPRAYDLNNLAFASVVCAGANFERSVELEREALAAGQLSIQMNEEPASVTLSIRTGMGKSIKETASLTKPPAAAETEKK